MVTCTIGLLLLVYYGSDVVPLARAHAGVLGGGAMRAVVAGLVLLLGAAPAAAAEITAYDVTVRRPLTGPARVGGAHRNRRPIRQATCSCPSASPPPTRCRHKRCLRASR